MKFGSIAFIVILNICLLVQTPARAQSRKEAEDWAASSNAKIAQLAQENHQKVFSLKRKIKKRIFSNLLSGASILDLAYSPNGQFLAVLIVDNDKSRIEVLDHEGHLRTKVPIQFYDCVAGDSKLMWDFSGRLLFLGTKSSDGTMKIWNAESGELDESIKMDAESFAIFSKTNEKIAYVAQDYVVGVIDLEARISKRFWIDQTTILGLAWLKDDILLVEGNKTESNYEVGNIQKVLCSSCPTGRMLMKINLNDLTILNAMPLPKTISRSGHIQVDDFEKNAFTGGGIWVDLNSQNANSLISKKWAEEWGVPWTWIEREITLSSSGKFIIFKAGDPRFNPTIVLIDTITKQPVHWLIAGYMGIALSPDEKTLVLGDKDSLLYYDLIETPVP